VQLAFGLQFEDLYRRDGLVALDRAFVDDLRDADVALHNRLMAGRADPSALAGKDESQLLIDLAPQLEAFIARLFVIEAELAALRARHDTLAPLYTVKRLFVQRRAAKAHKEAEASGFDGLALAADLAKRFGAAFDDELVFARHVDGWLADEAAHAEDLDIATRYAAWALHAPAGKAKHKAGILFKAPHKLEMEHLVPVATETVDGIARMMLTPDHWRRREGFALTDPGTDLKGALDQTNYCIWCHEQGKDSCSKGLREKTGAFKKSVFGVTLAGCPLEEKISELNLLKSQGCTLGALAVVTIDNPMCAATGHRICNDCMKSCIYQRQEPVDIPQAETRTLKDVLELPWGFEIYSLLTRWNPLDLRRPLPKPESGYKVLVVGLGPAGFTLAHHLMNDGHTVAAIDGLKIEPLPAHISGVDAHGKPVPFEPIRDVATLYEALGERAMAGFGGVAEYGITVRWNKNFLKLIRLLLERRREFAMFGGVRFGGTLTIDQAFALGFDHIALCAGAGRPTILSMPNGLARGVRQASDFLMALQLTGAAKSDSIANLQIRLPVVIVGGGLTAVDTATESLAYYPLQVEKFLVRYEALVAERGEQAVRAGWSEEDGEIAEEFIAHAKALRAERAKAAAENRAPRLIELLRGWGGATIAYRRRLIDAPSYTLNHEEVTKAMEEGISFVETVSPVAVEIDRFGAAAALKLTRAAGPGVGVAGQDQSKTSEQPAEITLPARSILIAAGTQPNTVLGREDPTNVAIDGKYFQALDEDGNKVTPERVAKPGQVSVLMSRRADSRFMSFFGDLHPSFAGNVVKAMGGAKQGYPVVSRALAGQAPSAITPAALLARLNDGLRATVHSVERLTPTIIEIVVRAPLAALAFQPGQFYRLQNYEMLATRTADTTLAMEGLALTGAWTDPNRGLISTIVLEMGGSSDLCTLLKPGEPVILMGPTGTPTDTPSGETVLLAGGGLGNAVLFSIGQKLRAEGSRVVYFAGYKRMQDRYKVEQIEAAADAVIWCSDEGPGFAPTRPQDKSFVGNIVAAMQTYAEGKLGPADIELHDCQRIIAIGSDRMMAAVAQARHGVLKPFLQPRHHAIGSINSPMQCMMKEICAQCLQPHRDPVTGQETVVFSCFNQDQRLDEVDWASLNARLHQNGVQEKLTRLWIDRCLRQLHLRQMAG
jgi:NADPH-dependent glutamate synthase beta subunit-like oxidoreductase/NAD(P)H-flavin reductase